MTEVSVILTAHREGILAGATVRSAVAAIQRAKKEADLDCEVVVVLDNATEETRSVILHGLEVLNDTPFRSIDVKTADPGLSRNLGIAEAKSPFSTFLDGDDLWSSNWIMEAYKFAKDRPDAVAQSMCNVTFGKQKNIWWHVDSEGELFQPEYLAWTNYWDAMSFASTEIYKKYPFKANDLKLGFGHEDWHWSVWTYKDGVPHKPVPGTIHFKRRRAGSQMSLVEKAGAVVWPT